MIRGGETELVFLVPCTEPGRDGTGDYARGVSDALRSRGRAVATVSLNDLHVDRTDFSGSEQWHLSAQGSWPAKRKHVISCVDRLKPDWISLQWVGFGYEKRGLPWPMIRMIAEVRRGRRLHVFFHEIWLGEKPGLPVRHRLLGQLQKWFTCHAVRRWKPDVVHTSNGIYQRALEANGIAAGILPLPGNLPIAEAYNGDSRSSDATFRVVLFGSIDVEWDPFPFVKILARWAEARNRAVEFVAVGNLGAGVGKWSALRERYAGARWLKLRETGFCSGEVASREFLAADIGATTKSFELLGKSGAFAALAEHGLPVVALRSPRESRWNVALECWEVPVLRFDPSVPRQLGEWLETARRQPPQSRLPRVATQFLNDLERAT